MGLLHANRVQRYFIHYSQRDIEPDYESDRLLTSVVQQIFVRFFQILVNSRKLLGLHFNVFNFYVFKNHTVNFTRQ